MATQQSAIERAANAWLVRHILRSGKVDRGLSFAQLVARHCADDPAIVYLARILGSGDGSADFVAEAPGVVAILNGLSRLSAGDEASMLVFDALVEELRGRIARSEAMDARPLRDLATDLPNRLLFTDRLDHAVAIANRQDAMVALIFIDFDFADARTYMGRVLREIADRLVHSVREVDTVARLSESRFALVITNIHKREDGAKVIEKLFEVLTMPFDVETSTFEVPFRIGMSFYPPHGHDAASLLEAGRAAVDRAEWKIGENIVVYEDR